MSTQTKYHAVYLALHNLNDDELDGYGKNQCLTHLLAAPKDSWAVIGITPAALEIYAQNGFKKSKGVPRGHLQPRKETASYVFDRPEPLSEKEFYDYCLPRDPTVICTKEENSGNKPMPPFIPIDTKKGLFPRGHIGHGFTKKEREFLKSLHADFLAGRIKCSTWNKTGEL